MGNCFLWRSGSAPKTPLGDREWMRARLGLAWHPDYQSPPPLRRQCAFVNFADAHIPGPCGEGPGRHGLDYLELGEVIPGAPPPSRRSSTISENPPGGPKLVTDWVKFDAKLRQLSP